MANAPESPPRAGEGKPAAGAGAAKSSERFLDVDVRSSASLYPRPRSSRRGARRIWLAAACAALVLGLTWVLFKSGKEPAPVPAPPLPVPPLAASQAADEAGRPAEGVIGFAPVPGQPEDSAETAGADPAAGQTLREDSAEPAAGQTAREDSAEPAASQPAPQAALPEPADQPASTPAAPTQTVTAKPAQAATPKPAQAAIPKPADKPAQATATTAKPADKPVDEPVDEPAQVAAPAKPADQPAPAVSTADKPAAGTAEISDKWVVNVSSTPDAAESLRFLSTLLVQDVGGRVYASEAILEGRLQHRIRVGFFDTREEAEAVGLMIKERFQLHSTPWAVRPSKEEETKYGSEH